MRIEVLLLGGLRAPVGAARVEVAVPEPATVADVRRAVAAAYPALAGLLRVVTVAVDLEVRGDDHPVGPTSEVALLPPVAGGAGPTPRRVVTGLTPPPFDVPAVLAEVTGPQVGGTAVFLGTVRDHAPDLEGVVRLDYEAYTPMAERVLAELADELLADHPEVTGLALLHATGALPVGSHTVLVVAAAAHRAAAFRGCEDALERIKSRVPVFKHEVTADGRGRWVGLPPPGGVR